MSAENLEQLIQQAGGDVVGMLRNAQIGNYAFPLNPEYTNWRDEQEAWATTAVLFDQSFHMTDVYFKGPDVKRFFSETAVNNFDKFGRNKAKQFVGVNEDGYVIGDGILFGLEDDEYALVGTGVASNWAAYRAMTGGYDLEVTHDPASVINDKPRKIFRFQLQGPNALKVAEKAYGGPLPAIKFFNMGEFTLAGVPVRALNHTMVGQPGMEHTGLEMTGPYDRGPEVWAALVEAGEEFGLKQGGGLAYPTTALETGWVPFPVPAIYTGEAMKGYREHLGVATLEANYAIAGSHVLPKIEDYYLTPWDLGYGRLVKFDHDFVGRSALEKMVDLPHRKKVWLRWNDEDSGRVLASSLFGGKNRAKYLKHPFTDYGITQNDTVRSDGRVVGVSTYCSYTVNIGGFASIGLIDEADAQDGAEVTLIWGEENGGTSRPNVERHVQTEIRATISSTPLN
jgi:vanillate/3-O-methylgallate O-demethylase